MNTVALYNGDFHLEYYRTNGERRNGMCVCFAVSPSMTSQQEEYEHLSESAPELETEHHLQVPKSTLH